MYWEWKQNFARPGVYPGSFLVFWKMNRHHRPLQEFSMPFLKLPEKGRVLDVGCGGGFFIASMLKRAPESHFYGVDYSPLSVKKSRSFNHRAVKRGQVEIVEGSVSSLPFEDAFFDLVTASETIYFWPDPAKDVREVARVVKPGGMFAVCCDSADKTAAKKYTDHIRGMTVYSAEELSAFFSGAGFVNIECHSDPATGMLCVTGTLPEKAGVEN